MYVFSLVSCVFCSSQHKKSYTFYYIYTYFSIFWLTVNDMGFLNFDVLMFIVVSLYDRHQSIQKYNWFLYANFITWDLAEFTYSRRVLGLCCIWSSFVIDSSGIPTHTIKSSINRDSFISHFPICVSFISFACLTALTKTCIMLLNGG